MFLMMLMCFLMLSRNKGACIAFDAKGLLDRLISICNAHDLPLPTEAEQLPLGNGSNPVSPYFAKHHSCLENRFCAALLLLRFENLQ